MKPIKHSILLLFAVLLGIAACEKDSSPTVAPKSIVGQWRWIYTYKQNLNDIPNPLTPENQGVEELLVFNANGTWCKTENRVKVDSGTYSTGHGRYLTLGNAEFIYDSVCYYRNGVPLKLADYYEVTRDTLLFSSYLGGRWWGYTLPHAGTKRWVKIP